MNLQFSSIDEILDYAIGKEEKAAEFYAGLAKQSLSEEMVKVFEDFEKTEIKHKKILEDVKNGKAQLKDESIQSLRIAEITDEAEIKPDMTIIEALRAAMKRELQAYRFYIELAAASTTSETLDIFVLLAQEEARHKFWLETEYKSLVENLVLTN